MRRLLLSLYMASIALSNAGCGELMGGMTVEGTIQDAPFDGLSGTADRFGDAYTITIADDSRFDCHSTPLGDYLTVVVDGVDGTEIFSAATRMSFNAVRGGMQQTEGATRGTIRVDRIDDPDDADVLIPRIEGYLSAEGPSSDISGDFSVTICS